MKGKRGGRIMKKDGAWAKKKSKSTSTYLGQRAGATVK